MHLDPLLSLTGLGVGFIVGLTGMGGGALMTPLLVLLFGIQPLAAVSSDLVAALVMKPVGGGVHLRRGTVNLKIVAWLMAGSIPAAFAGVLVLKSLGDGTAVADRLKIALGLALCVAAAAMVVKSRLAVRRARTLGVGEAQDATEVAVRPLLTAGVGAIGGLLVGMTSVGSGSLIIVLLLLVYPKLTAKSLVGTDLVQAIPLVASATLGHVLFGDVHLAITGSLLIGSIPGVYLGARLSAKADDALIRPILVLVLLLSGAKLLGAPTTLVGLGAIPGVLLALYPTAKRLTPKRIGAATAASRSPLEIIEVVPG